MGKLPSSLFLNISSRYILLAGPGLATLRILAQSCCTSRTTGKKHLRTGHRCHCLECARQAQTRVKTTR
ncbi:hypothetical protein PF005_g9524 [Phytophthora fragariae]|uniref:Uncharacterized protein n=2 Tax=Phytophthora TaxID=4783 RepID=A0A6A3FVF7_9STRA|nr:hypothetical protein PF003_g20601 [Phytophthora fragariae]KAE8964305.1 hypothetical protein PR002_g29017 [Phytophthora rubi]KAE8950205.1 hypothetical protein PF009_g269 [Phytophthora fragariae]KAE8964488.1 hypothetical protein PR001_g29041 [Phytophthora rubi]KAE9031362.1 hypothetical protein PF011_g132 [Phytophthora fragariae]